MKTTKLFTVTAIFTILFSISSYGQRGMGRGMQSRPTFKTFDLNGDGTITADEFKKVRAQHQANRKGMGRNAHNAPSFKSIDLNGDGVILPSEFAKFQAKRHRNFKK